MPRRKTKLQFLTMGANGKYNRLIVRIYRLQGMHPFFIGDVKKESRIFLVGECLPTARMPT